MRSVRGYGCPTCPMFGAGPRTSIMSSGSLGALARLTANATAKRRRHIDAMRLRRQLPFQIWPSNPSVCAVSRLSYAMGSDESTSKVDFATIQREYEAVRPRYVGFADALRVLLTQLCRDEGIAVESVSARAKDTASVIDKFKRKPEYTSLADVQDKCGLRVVTRYQADIDAVARLILTGLMY